MLDCALGSESPLNPSSAPHARRGNSNVVVPKRVGVPAVRLPAKVDGRDLGLDGAPLPLGGVGVRDAGLAGQAGDDVAVEPRLDGAVRAEVVLEALPAAGGEGGRGGGAL